MKKLMLAVLAALLLCLPGTALADEAYTITSYDVAITVSENNVLDVVERIKVNYTQQRHGIEYGLQVAGTGYYYIDGSLRAVRYDQPIYNFRVEGAPFELWREDDYLIARIGDPDKYVYGEQEYVVTYQCDAGDNGFDEFDDFYRNIINCAQGDIIEQASFSIELPSDFDAELVKATMGTYGAEDTSGVTWEKVGNRLVGKTLRPMTGGETLTVRMEFPDDFFVNENGLRPWDYAIIITCGLLAALVWVLWMRYGRDKAIYPTVEFYAPEGMTPAEVGYVIDSSVEDRDVVSLILYWADKGYLKIDEKEKNEFELIKLRDIDEAAKNYEKIMFNGLFAKGDAVAVSSLKNSFYMTMSAVKASIRSYFERPEHRLFTKTSQTARRAAGVLIMVPIALTMLRFVYETVYSLMTAVVVALLVGVVVSAIVFIIAAVAQKWHATGKKARAVKLVLAVAVLLAVLLLYVVAAPAMFGPRSVVAVYVSAGATLAMLAPTILMKKRTDQSVEWLGKLIGFRTFIEKAEKERILLLVEQNPSYFYNVLPYAYVMGITDKWAKNFEGIGVEPPGWYGGVYDARLFNAMLFANMISHNMTQFQSTLTSQPQPSSTAGSGGFSGGGGFGGGGFSGGGFGGGGVRGSW